MCPTNINPSTSAELYLYIEASFQPEAAFVVLKTIFLQQKKKTRDICLHINHTAPSTAGKQFYPSKILTLLPFGI